MCMNINALSCLYKFDIKLKKQKKQKKFFNSIIIKIIYLKNLVCLSLRKIIKKQTENCNN